MLKVIVSMALVLAGSFASADQNDSADKRGRGGFSIGIGRGGITIGIGRGGHHGGGFGGGYGRPMPRPMQHVCVAQNLRGQTFRGVALSRYEAQQQAYYRCLSFSRACRVVSCY